MNQNILFVLKENYFLEINFFSSTLLIFIFVFLQIIIRSLFTIIENNFNIRSKDIFRLNRNILILIFFLFFLIYTKNINLMDISINFKLLTFYTFMALVLLVFENLYLNNDTEISSRLKKYPVSEKINILLISPIVEEIICRNLILNNWDFGNIWVGLVISTMVFVLFHFQFKPVQLLLLTFYGLILGGCYISTESVMNPILIHIIINFIQLIINKHKTFN